MTMRTTTQLLVVAANLAGWSSLASASSSSSSSSSSTSKPHHHHQLNIEGYLEELPETGRDWITLDTSFRGNRQGGGVEFLPAEDFADLDLDGLYQEHRKNRHLSSTTASYFSGYSQQFVDGSGHYYNDYAQAWRLLGFYIDCNAPAINGNECYGEGENGGGERGGDDNQPACQRYLLWAAYVDLDYAGGGIGEYQFYNRHTHQWDSTSCIAGNGRCAKMDCHLKDSNFKLLGFFKEPNYHEWMEQLFKHQGVCLWTDEEYSFMQTDRYLWPCYCTSTGQTDEDGNTLYYDTKPMPEGRIGIGLYTDNKCKYDYIPKNGEEPALDILEKGGGDRNKYGSVAQLRKGLEQWNDAFDVFKVCQPCKAYNLGYNKDVNKGDRKGGDEDAGYSFACYDDADYLNVNQCMKFKTKTEMLAADFRDLMLAHEQGNIVEFEVIGKTYGYGGYRTSTGTMARTFSLSAKSVVPVQTIVFFCFSLLFFIVSIIIFVHLYNQRRRSSRRALNVPLMT